jgi:formyl-CoA transferase
MHRDFGELAMQNVAPRLSATPGKVRHPGPALGEHTAAVLGGRLGLSAAELDRLGRDGVI